MLEDAAEVDPGDFFEFLIGRGRPIQAEGAEGGLRFPVRCLLAGRDFERLRLDINLVPGDPRQLDRVELRNLFDFTDLPPVVVPAVPPPLASTPTTVDQRNRWLSLVCGSLQQQFSRGDRDTVRGDGVHEVAHAVGELVEEPHPVHRGPQPRVRRKCRQADRGQNVSTARATARAAPSCEGTADPA